MFRKEHSLDMNRELLVGFSMGMTLDIKAYPYTYAESQGSNEHCQSHFALPPFLGCNKRAETNNAKHVAQRTIFTNIGKGLKNSLAMPSTNIALPRSAINFATKIWYFSLIGSIAKSSISFDVKEVNNHYFGSLRAGLTLHFNNVEM